ncbi:MAG TPA: diguanylate cyclase [Lachnospiraceae bacterium]|nr:diguanylate cyclase [Lachnospiraceae bacterium]
MTKAYLLYAIVEFYCIIYIGTISHRLTGSIGSEYEVRQLRRMIYSYIGMLVADILWALNMDNIITMPLFLNKVINAIDISCIVFGCYFWYRFLEDRLMMPSSRSRTIYWLSMVPMIVAISLDFISIFTGWLFYIDAEGNYQSTDLFWIHTLVNYYYLAVPTVATIHAAIHAKTKDERSEYLTYMLYMIAPLISGFLEDYFPGVPLLALNIFMVIQIMFLMIQNKQVNNDALTGLNNRKRLSQYLRAVAARADAEHPVVLYMIDINHFKSINDTYGHLEGDKALNGFASLLKEFAARHDAFAARYGGDEFCMVMNSLKTDPEQLIKEFHSFVKSRQSSGQSFVKPYIIQASMGYCIVNEAGRSTDEIIGKADRMLYENKKTAHGFSN